MAKLILAKTAGFCFGVDRAVKLVDNLIDKGIKTVMLGPVIHNPDVIEDFKSRGVCIVNSISEVESDTTLVLRAHGVEKSTMETLEEDGIKHTDSTCPYVKKIHKIVKESPKNTVLIICGNPKHPEVMGIRSYALSDSFVVENELELEKLLKNNHNFEGKFVILVAQTTFSTKEWEKSAKKAKLLCTNIKIFDTICSATEERQKEAYLLSLKCDAMIIIGGKQSSNTAKLAEVCRENAKTFLVENSRELMKYDFRGFDLIGISAGASTPAGIIKEVLETMSEIVNENAEAISEEKEIETTEAVIEQETEAAKVDEAEAAEVEAEVTEAKAEKAKAEVAEAETVAPKAKAEEADEVAKDDETADDDEHYDYEAALEESLSNYGSEKLVVGTVISITPTEIQVDIGRKQTGYIPYDEYSSDPNADPNKELKPGDTLDLIIMKTNDLEGTVMLSKRICDAAKVWDDIVAAEQSGESLEGTVCDIIRGGLLVRTKGVRIFIPASLSGVSRDGNLEELLNTTVNFRIIEVNKQRKRAVGSIRAALRETRKEAEKAFWSAAEEGQVIKGTVKSLTSYGAFVDIGGVDGMIHISELSWKRIKHPSEVVNAGDTVEVYIKKLDFENKKISLGYKKTEDNPWEILKKDYPVDSVVDVKIVGLTTFGAFAQIIPGIDGLIHISQIANRRIAKTSDALAVGDCVTAKITDINFEKKRVSLSVRALLPPDVEPDYELEVKTVDNVTFNADDASIQTPADSQTPASDAAPSEDGIVLAKTPDEITSEVEGSDENSANGTDTAVSDGLSEGENKHENELPEETQVTE